MTPFLIIVCSLLLLDLLWWWWADSRLRTAFVSRRRRVARVALATLMLVLIAGYVFVIGSRWVGIRQLIPAAVLTPIYLWHLIVMPATLVLALIGWPVWAAVSLAIRRQRETSIASKVESERAPTRRQVLAAVVVALPPLAVTGASGAAFLQLGTFRVRRIDVPLINLPPALDGLTIAQVSDVHVGRFTRGKMLPKIADATNALRPDLVLMTGDLIDFMLADLTSAIDFVKKIDARHGLFMVEGNHDLFESRREFEQRVINAGVPLLLNDTRTVRVRGIDVQLAGIKWGGIRPMGGGRGGAFEQHFADTLPLIRRDADAFPILLAHHPHVFDLAADAGIPLTLAGHTHGGQLNLTPNFGAGSMMFKYWSGLYRRNDSALVVSNGVGNWFPLRVNAPAEIVHITLRRGSR